MEVIEHGLINRMYVKKKKKETYYGKSNWDIHR